MRPITICAAIVLMGACLAHGQMAIEQWTPAQSPGPHKAKLTIKHLGDDEAGPGPWLMRIDVSDLPADRPILHASLHARRDLLDGHNEQGNVDVRIHPLSAELPAGGGSRSGTLGEPLALEGPWFDSFDVTEVVKGWVKDPKANHGLYVRAFPLWRPELTRLEIRYRGKSEKPPAQIGGLRAVHRAGQTFITWNEVDPKIAKEQVTWGELQAAVGAMDKPRRVRYRVYRHTEPIAAASIDRAELLAEVAPFSAYNANGRSVDVLIAQVRRRAMTDNDVAINLARTNYFSKYDPEMPQMSEVAINRLAIEDGKPLPTGVGLYVHCPDKPGKAFYAVLADVDGVVNCTDFSSANASSAVEEKPGAGEPVLQGTADVTVFFDYPGQRFQYVQWAPGGMANLPNQYYNWGIYVPHGYADAKVKRLSVTFHDSQQRFLRPPWLHRRDTVLLSPHDFPFKSFGYGYHEALGTLRSFQQGAVRPYFALRTDAMVDWALKKFNADATRVSCGGSGYWAGTAALQYGLRRFGRIAYVMADGNPDPDPRQTTPEAIGRRENLPRLIMDASWGKPEWTCKAESGKSIWEEMNLPAYVKASTTPVPFASLGFGSQHVTWPQEADLMQALMESRNAFMASFFWGSSTFHPLPVDAGRDLPFEPGTDQPMIACWPKSTSPIEKFYEVNFLGRKRGYNGGSRFNTRPRWSPDEVVDAPDRLELTIFSARVEYAGTETTEATIRNAQNFRPAPGQTVAWSVLNPKTNAKAAGGEVKVNDQGLIVIPELTFSGTPARLVIEKMK